VVVFGLLVWAFGAQHDWRIASILVGVALIFSGWYLAAVHPHRCNEPVFSRPGGSGCAYKAFGLLFGCRRFHRFDRLRRIFGSDSQRRNRSSDITTPPKQRVTPTAASAARAEPAPLAARFTLCCTAISTAAGVLSVIVGVMALPSS
jgi:hypothetical protein